MLGIPRRYAHFIFGVIQAGLTTALAAAIASYSFFAQGTFIVHWLMAWLLSWSVMLPVVVVAAPLIRNLATFLTREEA